MRLANDRYFPDGVSPKTRRGISGLRDPGDP